MKASFVKLVRNHKRYSPNRMWSSNVEVMILARFAVVATERELGREVRGLEPEMGSGIEREVGVRSYGRLVCSSARSAENPGLHRTV